MGIGFTLAGLFLIVTGAQNTYAAAGAQIDKDFTGQNNFGYWLVALVLVGALGYINSMKTFSTYFMSLVLLALFLSKGTGFFSQFSTALEGAANAPANAVSQTSASSGSIMQTLFGSQYGATANTQTSNTASNVFNGFINSIFGIGAPKAATP